VEDTQIWAVTAQPMPGFCGEIGVHGGVHPGLVPSAHLFRRYFLLRPEQILWDFITENPKTPLDKGSASSIIGIPYPPGGG
jgi:hypothetical protein